MLTSSYTKNLEGYFSRSGSLYYVVTDPQGSFLYTNPFFQEQFNHIAANFYGKNVTGIFDESESDNVKHLLRQCYDNPFTVTQAYFPILSASGFNQMTRWEFSAVCNQQGIAENIQAIGFQVEGPENAIAK